MVIYDTNLISDEYPNKKAKITNDMYLDIGASCEAKEEYKIIRHKRSSGDDNHFINYNDESKKCFVGVADGVYGWNELGIDPYYMSYYMMQLCNKRSREVCINDPKELLRYAYDNIKTNNKVEGGSTTICMLMIEQDENNFRIKSTNIGDSGYVVIRNEKIVFRSEFQRDYKVPFQMAVIPERFKYLRIQDNVPDDAENESFCLQEDDIVVLATDGLWDNVLNINEDENRLTQTIAMLSHYSAKTVAEEITKLAIQEKLKEDDITVIVIKVKNTI